MSAHGVIQPAVEPEPGEVPELTLWCAVVRQAVRDSYLQAANGRDQLSRQIARLLLVGIDAGWWHHRVVPALRAAWAAKG